MNDVALRDVIWLDDEHGSRYAFALAPWRRALEQNLGRYRARLLCCRTLDSFADQVKQGVERKSIALLIIDVMLAYDEPQHDFSPLGFPDEALFPLEAGAQIAGLLRSSEFDGKRPEWLAAACSTPLMMLSASPQTHSWVVRNVGASRMKGVAIVLKNLSRSSDGHTLVPAAEFVETLDQLLVR
ncbi:hypothetical protein [Ideonella sp. A 288]|uniref:hypothetical protein n=1 Tax=Ideonella sp. A 288 TaxID=1962181 RepID=UPI0011853E3C|nr:hypothetical protein [Ideonella sp. A 288]